MPADEASTGDAFIDLSAQPRSIRRRIRRHVEQTRQLSPVALRALLLERLSLSEERRLLAQARAARADSSPAEPLVTVRITTYNRGHVVVDRAIAAALAQTYRNIEVLVVGDACSDDTEELVNAVGDPRVRFVNLPTRPPYPADDVARWLVLGYAACNLGLDLARGDWIAPCDDDDEFTPHHVEVLLGKAMASGAEFVHSRTAVDVGDGRWAIIGRPEPTLGHVTHGCVLYSSALRFMRYRESCWELGEPLDWNLFRRMLKIGVRMAYLDDVTYRYYPSGATADDYRNRYLRASKRPRGVLARARALTED